MIRRSPIAEASTSTPIIHFLPSIIQVLLVRNDQRVLPQLGAGRIYNPLAIIAQGLFFALADGWMEMDRYRACTPGHTSPARMHGSVLSPEGGHDWPPRDTYFSQP
jgi:hypothetical protein